MDHLTLEQRESLIYDIASREYTIDELMSDYACTRDQLKTFVAENHDKLTRVRAENFPEHVDDPLWIANKNDRLKRLQAVADLLYDSIINTGLDQVTLRELRAYLNAAAQELGQLLNRGSGDAASGDTLNVEFPGVDMDQLR